MKCDRALLSSYLDNDLPAADRQRLETHVLDCAECAQALDAYRGLRFQIRDDAPRRAPPSLRAAVESGIQTRRRQAQLRWLPIAIGAPLSLIGILAGAALVAPRAETSPQLSVTATSPATGATRVALNGAVELWFDRELMAGAAGATVTVDPPLPIRIAVDGNSLRIDPDGAFEPGQTYTVAVQSVVDVDGRRLRNPAVVSFMTAPTTVADVTTALGSPRGEALSVPSAAVVASGVPERAAAPLPALSSVPASVAGPNVETVTLGAQTRKWPAARGRTGAEVVEPSPETAAIADALGALVAPYQTVRLVEQAFQGGVMIRLGDTAQSIVMQRTRGRWQSYSDVEARQDLSADTSLPPPPGALTPTGAFGALWQQTPAIRTALGWAVYEARLTQALVQQRERGTAVTLGRMAYLLRSDGTWSVVPLSRPTAAAE